MFCWFSWKKKQSSEKTCNNIVLLKNQNKQVHFLRFSFKSKVQQQTVSKFIKIYKSKLIALFLIQN